MVVLSSTPGFWDIAKTNTAIYYLLFFGWDVTDLGSLLQFSLNILKTDGDNQCFLASISPSHNMTAIYLLSTEIECHAEIYFTSHYWSYHNCHSYGSPLWLLLYLYQWIPSRDTVWFQTNFIIDYRVSRVLILSFELPAISFWAKASSQHVSCLTLGNWISSLICFQWNFTELGTSIF